MFETKLTRGQWLLSVLPIAALAQQKRENLDPAALETLLKDKKNVFLLDVRQPKELVEVGSIEGYTNIPLDQLEKRLSEVPKDKTIVTLCARGVRAATAADILTKHGYKVAGTCGMTGWKAKNKPVVFPKKT